MEALNIILHLFIRFPILDAIFAFFWLRAINNAWKNATPAPNPEPFEERELGATVILAQLNGVITGCSIILAAIGAFAALSIDKLQLTATNHIRISAISATLALGAALYTIAILTSRTPKENFVRSKSVAILCSISLMLVLISGFRFMFGLITIL